MGGIFPKTSSRWPLILTNLCITRQVYNLLQGLLNRSPYFEGWGVGERAKGAKAVQTGCLSQRGVPDPLGWFPKSKS